MNERSHLHDDDVDPARMLVGRFRLFAKNLDARVAEHPAAALGVALGVGFVLGGGLSSRVGRMLMMSAARTLLRRLA
jgi:ElaB/YqjD/DUF883 family membrane-anchored ribosome-binding protein